MIEKGGRGVDCLHAGAERIDEAGAAGPLLPRFGGDFLFVAVELIEERFYGRPAAAGAGIHDLEPGAVATPDDDKVVAAFELDDGEAGEGGGGWVDDVIDGQHDLRGVEAELLGDFFDGIDGGAVDFGVAGFAEAAVGDGAAEAFEDGF